MKQQIIRIFVNALVGAVASAASVWLGANAAEAIVAGSAGSAALGNAATNFANAAIEAAKSASA